MAADWQITSTKVFDLRPDGAGELGSFRTPPGSFTIGFTNDGTGVVSSVDDGLVGVWNAADGTRRSTIDGVPSPGFVISPDGTLVAAAGPEGFPVTLREMATGREVAEYDVPDGWLDTIAWSPDSRHLAVAYGTEPGSVVTVLDLSLEVLATKDRPGFFVAPTSHSAPMAPDSPSPGRGRDRFDPVEDRAIIWDWQADEVVTTLDEVALQVEFDPTSDRLATLLFNESTFVAFDAQTGERLTEFTGHGGLVRDLRYSGDGNGAGLGVRRLHRPRGTPVPALRSRCCAPMRVRGRCGRPDGIEGGDCRRRRSRTRLDAGSRRADRSRGGPPHPRPHGCRVSAVSAP